MKLSEAIMLPSEVQFEPNVYLEKGKGCLLGQAMNAATGITDCRMYAILEQWPWLWNKFIAPPEVAGEFQFMRAIRGGITTGENIITRYAFLVEAGLLTREQCADWVASVEPAEEQQPEVESVTQEVSRLQ